MVNKGALGLMIVFLGILVIPGIVINNLSANGLVNSSQAMTCNNSAANPTCTLSAKVGCAVTTPNSYCGLQGNSIQFLNSCSPFTNILTLNLVGFVSSFFSSCNNGISSAAQQYTLTSFNNIALPQGNTNYTVNGCTYTGTVTGYYGQQALHCTTITPVIQGMKTPLHACVGCLGPLFWNGVIGTINSTTGAHVSYVTVNFNDSSTTTNYFTANCLVYGIYKGSPGANGNVIQTLICNNFLGVSVVTSTGNQGTANVGQILSFALSLVGISLILLIGLGVNISLGGSVLGTGTSASVGSNPQGSKLAQVFGIALLIWFPLYSEFSTWFTSGFLPYGLDGLTGVVNVILIAGFFFGAWEMSQTTTSGGSNVNP